MSMSRSRMFKQVLFPITIALMASFFFACASGTNFGRSGAKAPPLQYDYGPFLMQEGFKGEYPFIATWKENPDWNLEGYESICQKRLAEIAADQGPESPEMGYMLIAGSAVSAEMRNWDEMEARQNRFLAVFEKLLGPDNPDMAHYWHIAGKNYEAAADFENMMECYKKVCALSESRNETIEAAYVEDVLTLGDALVLFGGFEEAEEYYQKVVKARIKILGPRDRDVARALCALGEVYLHMADYGSAKKCFETAYKIEFPKYIGLNQIVAKAYAGLAVVYLNTGENESARYHSVFALTKLDKESPAYKAAYVNCALFNISPKVLTRAEIYQKGYIAALDLLPSKNNRFYAANLYKLGVIQVRLGEFNAAEKNLTESVRIYEKNLGENNIHACTAMLELARLHIAVNKPDQAEELLERASAILSQNSKIGLRLQGETLLQKANLEFRQAKHSEAVNSYKKSLEVLKSLYGEVEALTALTQIGVAWQYMSEGKYGEARPILEDALEICSREFGRKSIFSCFLTTRLALLIMADGDMDKAMAMLEKVVDIEKDKLRGKSPNFGDTLLIVAIGHMELGEYEPAEEKALQALQILEYNLGEYREKIGDAQALLADIYFATGRLQEAKDRQEKAVAIYEIAIPPGHYHIGDACNSLGIIQAATGDYKNAVISFEKAQAVMEGSFGSDHRETGVIYKNMAICYKAMGEDEQAQSYFDKAAAIQGEIDPSSTPVFTSGLGKFWRNWARE
ncbi:TPR repeat-containing protein [Desulfatibacillum aliphaticivorans]|uniref:TPR repeat-containing protein n=1 Tax=Desulfatibacillum aliphaticivorans TaxID=218208 RepID=B8FG13_DESAL|nr:tetratricopeptide repeat protein [Desulfatibacillum aliphaticivorans]ACL03693.1 TPR repeat-containing protein [Desulfatibacillum aliphaticivorans]